MALSMRRYITRWLYQWLDREPRGSVLSTETSPHLALGDSEKIKEEESRANWREAARARAICEAEDAGLRGSERQVFITDRTELYYAELEMLLGDA
jgi:hypothetical protein